MHAPPRASDRDPLRFGPSTVRLCLSFARRRQLRPDPLWARLAPGFPKSQPLRPEQAHAPPGLFVPAGSARRRQRVRELAATGTPSLVKEIWPNRTPPTAKCPSGRGHEDLTTACLIDGAAWSSRALVLLESFMSAAAL
jgi:hypothetical protein